MARVTIQEAKTHLSRLLRRVTMGEEIVIYRGKQPVAQLVPVLPRSRALGIDAGRIKISSDFDSPLPDEILDDVEK